MRLLPCFFRLFHDHPHLLLFTWHPCSCGVATHAYWKNVTLSLLAPHGGWNTEAGLKVYTGHIFCASLICNTAHVIASSAAQVHSDSIPAMFMAWSDFVFISLVADSAVSHNKQTVSTVRVCGYEPPPQGHALRRLTHHDAPEQQLLTGS